MAKKKQQSRWSGLPVHLLQELEQQICRCRLRTELSKGHVGVQRALCRLNRRIWSFIGKKFETKDKPKIKEITHYLKTHKKSVLDNHVADYLKDEIDERSAKWEDIGYNLFIYLVRGPGPINGEKALISNRITYYFFREKSRPEDAFLSLPRLPYGEPCSLTELAGEIAWLVRQVAADGSKNSQNRIVFVSGKPAFPFKNSAGEDHVAQEIVHAAKAGIQVIFICGSKASDASESAKEFQKNNAYINSYIKTIELDESKSSAWDFLDCLHTWLYIDVDMPDDRPALYMVRSLLPSSGPTPSGSPVILEAAPPEISVFENWLGKHS